jgi:hypothetical protein
MGGLGAESEVVEEEEEEEEADWRRRRRSEMCYIKNVRCKLCHGNALPRFVFKNGLLNVFALSTLRNAP